jgi:N-acetylmuramoyl-L-alanine amidase
MPRQERDTGFGYVVREMARHVGVVFLVGATVATVASQITPDALLPRGVRAGISIAKGAAANEAGAAEPTAAPVNQQRVGIVAGHKGNDSGAVCPDGLTEAQVNLEVAGRVQETLQLAGYAVDVLDEFDTRLEGYRAAALVAIHADSCEYINELATGYKVAGSLAATAPEKSAALTECIIQSYVAQTKMNFHANSITRDMTFYHAYREIDPDTPATIIELGFLNLDREILESRPDLTSAGVSNGILCFLRGNQPNP